MGFFKRFLYWLRIECDSDKCDGKLYQNKVHITRFGTAMNVYECDKCKKEWIAL